MEGGTCFPLVQGSIICSISFVGLFIKGDAYLIARDNLNFVMIFTVIKYSYNTDPQGDMPVQGQCLSGDKNKIQNWERMSDKTSWFVISHKDV